MKVKQILNETPGTVTARIQYDVSMVYGIIPFLRDILEHAVRGKQSEGFALDKMTNEDVLKFFNLSPNELTEIANIYTKTICKLGQLEIDDLPPGELNLNKFFKEDIEKVIDFHELSYKMHKRFKQFY